MPMPTKANPELPKLSATFQLLTTLITNLLLNLPCVWWLLDLARALHVVCTPVIVCVCGCVCVSPAYAQLEIFKLTNKLCALRPPKLTFERHPKDSMAWQRQQSAKWDTKHPQRVLEWARRGKRLFRRPRRPHLHLVSTSWATLTYHQSYINVSATRGSGRCSPADFWQLPHNCLATLARHSSTDNGANRCGSHKGKI